MKWFNKKKEEKTEVVDNKVNEREIAFHDEHNGERLQLLNEYLIEHNGENVIAYNKKLPECLKYTLKCLQKIKTTTYNGCSFCNFVIRDTYWLIKDNIYILFDVTFGDDTDLMFFKLKKDYENIEYIDFVITDKGENILINKYAIASIYKKGE